MKNKVYSSGSGRPLTFAVSLAIFKHYYGKKNRSKGLKMSREHNLHVHRRHCEDWANWGLLGRQMQKDACVRELRRLAEFGNPYFYQYRNCPLETWTLPMLLVSLLKMW